jgi:hypothetical protein
MKYKKLNIDWNAEPNAPQVELQTDGDKLRVSFFLNPFIFDNVDGEERGELIFVECLKYSFNSCNDEGYYSGQYRYKNALLPWGEFYELEHDWEKDFHKDLKILNPSLDKGQLRHFIFFLKDNTLECIAKDFEFRYVNS